MTFFCALTESLNDNKGGKRCDGDMSVEYANVEALSTHEHNVSAESSANVRLILDSKAASLFSLMREKKRLEIKNTVQTVGAERDFSLCFALIP